ncbi:transglycosylase domain-containing protein [Lysinibacillus pakistanensis]|uniref:PBP1A family penicillin-binding protein n=1 Tax=Lysinibacillus pakistanensis TaxID=759811 RepID=A0AAX3WWK1_9BACI|nr:PBP1A family penicillin-binding protein [Lysinibacillus pakistanensis]MDM5231666.1 PBP1A family penicillin-binding protein [Lysinibacillus pakistanensis]QGG49903.1 PBP1A family penicillin-binding protein [Lysinibacillus pakistanensis]WHY47207.1 PBP1A family penicillin-binding protein [Lysinibacillus pakistanensis]WHY52216.1 PBP1A family penicillin-binding protein [Lysinibacillus pakistanensis]
MKRKSYQRKQKRAKRTRKTLTLFIAFTSAIVVAFIALRVYVQVAGAPPLTVPKASIFLDENENQIGDHFTNERRYWVSLDEMSPYLKTAVVSVEDKDFYKHSGFDFSRIAGAVLIDLKAGSKVQGASTITQQYARNLYLSHEKSWTRKLNEALYAYRLEVFYDKDEILEGYLNTVYYGHGMYGVEAASRFYFGKSASDLTLAEAAMLTGVPKGPSIYSPIANLEKATNRQHVILKLMADQGAITQDEKTRAESEQLVLKNDSWVATKSVAPYFLDVAWQEASDILKSKNLDISEGGWTIQTTLDPGHQKAAEEAVAKNLPANDLQASFVSMESKTGAVTALVGGRDYAASSFNRVTQAKRQPGSTIKPILYAAALENGYNPLTFLDVGETTFTYDNGRGTYSPKNVNGEFATHDMSMAQAIAISDNIYAVKTLEEIGFKPFHDMAKRFNVNIGAKDNLSIALGTAETTLYEMTNAYNILASQGQKTLPTTIVSIKNAHGDVIYENKEVNAKSETVLSKENTYILTEMMTGIFDPVFSDYSPATGISIRSRMTHTYAAKSGSTNSDQWLIGFTPSLTAGVWNGYDQGKNLTTKEDTAATKKIWIDFMENVNKGTKNEDFVKPKNVKGVVVDIETGKLATDACPKQRLVYLDAKDVPTEKCTNFDILDTNTWGEFWNMLPFSIFKN